MATTITMNECLRERCKSAKTINKVSEFLNRDMPTQLKNDFDNGDTRGLIESRGVERRREYCMLWCTKTIISTARHSSSLRPTSSGGGPCCSVEGPSVGKRSFALAQPINSVLLQFPATFHSSPLGTPHQLKPLGVGLPASVGKSNKKY